VIIPLLKQEYIKEHYLSDKVPDSDERCAVGAVQLSDVICGFLDANFKGAYDLDYSLNEDGYIAISVDYLAYFMRTLLADIYGRALLRIKLYSGFSKLQLEFSYDPIKLTEGEETELRKIAEFAGFKVSFYKNRVFICTQLSGSFVSSLYAVAPESLRGIFSFCFFGEHARRIERYNKEVKGLRL
jgi:hypothetical protein